MDEAATAGFIEVENADLSKKEFCDTENGSTELSEPTIDLNGTANYGSQTGFEGSPVDGLTTATNMAEDKLTHEQSSRLIRILSPKDIQTGQGYDGIDENRKPQDCVATVEHDSSKLLISISKPDIATAYKSETVNEPSGSKITQAYTAFGENVTADLEVNVSVGDNDSEPAQLNETDASEGSDNEETLEGETFFPREKGRSTRRRDNNSLMKRDWHDVHRKLVSACRAGDSLEVVKQLGRVRTGERAGLLNSVDKGGNTALLYVTETDHTDIVHKLLNFNADPNKANSSGDTPLHRACALGNYELVRMLMNSGADTNIVNKDNNTPIEMACDRRSRDKLQMFMIDVGNRLETASWNKMANLFGGGRRPQVAVPYNFGSPQTALDAPISCLVPLKYAEAVVKQDDSGSDGEAGGGGSDKSEAGNVGKTEVVGYVVGFDGSCVLWDFAEKQPLESFSLCSKEPLEELTCSAMFSDYLVTGYNNGFVGVWQVPTIDSPSIPTASVKLWDTHQNLKVNRLLCPPATDSIYSCGCDGTFRIRNLKQGGRLTMSYERCTCPIIDIVVDKNTVYLGACDGVVTVLDTRASKCVAQVHCGAPLPALPSAADASGAEKGASGSSGESDAANPCDGAPLEASPCRCLALSPTGNLFAGHGSSHIVSWDPRTWEILPARYRDHTDVVNALAFNAVRLYSAADDGSVRVFDEATGACVETLKGHKTGISLMVPAGDALLTYSLDHTLLTYSFSHINTALEESARAAAEKARELEDARKAAEKARAEKAEKGGGKGKAKEKGKAKGKGKGKG
eukprot:950950_1